VRDVYTQRQLQVNRRAVASHVIRLQHAQASDYRHAIERPADVTLAIAERLLDTVYSARSLVRKI